MSTRLQSLRARRHRRLRLGPVAAPCSHWASRAGLPSNKLRHHRAALTQGSIFFSLAKPRTSAGHAPVGGVGLRASRASGATPSALLVRGEVWP